MTSSIDTADSNSLENFDFTKNELYIFGLKFLREKDGKAFHLTYASKQKLIAYTMHIKHGPYDPAHAPDTGLLDVVGRDRKACWQNLGSITKEEAIDGFLTELDHLCPLFLHVVEANQKEKEEKERLRREEEERLTQELEEKKKMANSSQLERVQIVEAVQQAENLRRTQHEAQIRSALNQQTIGQFRQYASQQYPKDCTKQEELILQLQEQHFQQYMAQVYQQQLHRQQENSDQIHLLNGWGSTTDPNHGTGPSRALNGNSDLTMAAELPLETGIDVAQQLIAENQENAWISPLEAPNMWNRKDIIEFKKSLNDDKNAVLKIGSGEVVTVRIPTHEEGSCLTWEFATDDFDIGFGLFFEWASTHPSDAPVHGEEFKVPVVGDVMSVHIAETVSDEEDDYAAEEDVETIVSAAGHNAGSPDNTPPGTDCPLVTPNLDEIVPVFRRDSQLEVYCGSHHYPGSGVYVLKFDNSYSLWRNKWLYYRVYYTK